MEDKIKFVFNKDNFGDFLEKLKDLTKIDNTIKLKIDKDNILMYSTLGQSVMIAFKSYLINTNDYLSTKSDIDFTLDLIIANANKFSKNLDFLKDEDKIIFDVSYKPTDEEDVMTTRGFRIKGGSLKVNWVAGEQFSVRDIPKSVISQRLDLRNRQWAFTLTNTQLSNIKKLSNINSDNIINIDVEDGEVVISEYAAWELKVGETEKKSSSFVFNKRFLKSINDDSDEIQFSLFDNFILIKNNNSDLMLSYEQDFVDDDV